MAEKSCVAARPTTIGIRQFSSEVMRRIYFLVTLLIYLLTSGCSVQRSSDVQSNPDFQAEKEAIFLGNCTATLTTDGEPSIAFSRNGVEIAKVKFADGESIDVVRTPDTNREALVKLKGFPAKVLIVRSVQDGPEYKYTFFDTTGVPRKVCTLSNGKCEATLVPDRKAHDVYELAMYDWYDNLGGARAVAPTVTLFWNGSRLAIDPSAMKNEPPDDEHTSDLRQAIGEQFAGMPIVSGADKSQSMLEAAPPELAAEVIDRVYMGNCKEARRFLDRTWPKNRPGKEAFWSFLKQEMRKSPYWLQIVSLNNGSKLLTKP